MFSFSLYRFSFLDFLRHSFSSLYDQATAKGLDFKVELAGSLPLFIVSDPTRLRQIIINLVGNAIKFTEKGQIQITVRVSQKPKRGDTPALEFLVTDTGPGIPVEHQNLIFEPFTQADTTMTRIYGGTGLGLNLSRKIARALGGEAELVMSQTGQGSTFKFFIQPKEASEYCSPKERSEFHLDAQGETHYDGYHEMLKNTKTLVVEDVLEIQVLMKDILEMFGAEVATVSTGQKAIDLVTSTKEQFDFIFMDIHMPEMNGYDTTRALRELGFQSTIIAVTARAMKEDKQRCFDAGCDDFISKPFEFSDILRAVKPYALKKAPSPSDGLQ